MNRNLTILIVEDDRAIRNLLSTALKTFEYNYITASNGKEALMMAMSSKPDIIILDLGLPDMEGIEIIKSIRGWSQCPIIVVCARTEDKDKVQALDEGADDYITKPFSIDELMARIRVAERRVKEIAPHLTDTLDIYHNGGLVIDYDSCVVTIDGKEVHLTPMEYKLLCLLAKNTGKVLTHNYILDQVWTSPVETDTNALRVFMATLRKKIEPNQAKPKYIQTHIGIGYRMLKIEAE